jgi:lipopolysaccharide transport system permease protein
MTGARDANVQRGWIENRAPSGRWSRPDFGELWRYREVAIFLALRDLRLRYKQTAFGVAWAVLQPLAGVAVFSLIFGRYGDLPSDGVPYPVFVYAGLSIWTYFSTAANAAAESLVQNRSLVTKIYFPRLLAPLAAVLPGLLDLFISLTIIGVFMLIYDVIPGTAVVFLPLWLLAAVATSLGAGVWSSALNVQYRDIRYTLPFLMQLWFFLTPVFYASSLVTGEWSFVFSLNPLVGVIDGFRWSLLSAPAPEPNVSVSLVSGMFLLLSGVLYFIRVERRFADVI